MKRPLTLAAVLVLSVGALGACGKPADCKPRAAQEPLAAVSASYVQAGPAPRPMPRPMPRPHIPKPKPAPAPKPSKPKPAKPSTPRSDNRPAGPSWPYWLPFLGSSSSDNCKR